ncbi:SDR family NAD(P)-dependent oxidoreductase [Chitinophaga rhizophila]|uniref:SDR family NAD(P)-dependent oxidoreductase n=1 Tax=Chitinophaga rhizophila TaxID=2866212 RepID=A0ABS7G6M4_9BACT|nr:SDR family NAD(P)-dependent oxidoreductase [Chitinophaga rhizophila]MBW8683302.1 SDR family NAD(P)-dependent oxidoreductase [Chitinophaga rhizophila]
MQRKTVLLLGANSDVAKAAMLRYAAKGFRIMAASRNTDVLSSFVSQHPPLRELATVLYFDAADVDSHAAFYAQLPEKPHIVVYAAGYLRHNEEALQDFAGSLQMMQVHYIGAVSILNIIAMDKENARLDRIIGLSSLSGVRGRKSNFIYGSTKSAFTQYLAGLRQYLFKGRVTVNVIVAGYIRSKMTAGLNLPESLMLEPDFIAKAVVEAGNGFIIVPGFKWKIIYNILRIMPERLVAKLP